VADGANTWIDLIPAAGVLPPVAAAMAVLIAVGIGEAASLRRVSEMTLEA
jgi:hypothetical protein